MSRDMHEFMSVFTGAVGCGFPVEGGFCGLLRQDPIHPPSWPAPADSKWVVQWRVHQSQVEDGTWVWVDVDDEVSGRSWFDRLLAGDVVIEARLVRMEPTVVREWRRE